MRLGITRANGQLHPRCSMQKYHFTMSHFAPFLRYSKILVENRLFFTYLPVFGAIVGDDPIGVSP